MHYHLDSKSHEKLFFIDFNPKITNYKYSRDLNYKIDFSDYYFYLFEVFESHKTKILFLITKQNTILNVYTLNDNKLIKRLEHFLEIVFFKYYTNNINKEFLISSTKRNISIYDTSNQFNKVSSIDSNTNINNSLLIFDIKNEDYLFYSFDDCQASLKLLKKGNTFAKLIDHKNSIDKYLIYWHNHLKEKDYLVLLCIKKVIIINLFEDEIYDEIIIEPESAYYHGYIYNKEYNNYLCISSINGYIIIYDLINKDIYKRISCPNCKLNEIFSLSERYLVSSNSNLSEFIIIDIDQGKVINSFRNDYKDCIYNVKSIIYKKFGRCILTCGTNKKIHLWRIFI